MTGPTRRDMRDLAAFVLLGVPGIVAFIWLFCQTLEAVS